MQEIQVLRSVASYLLAMTREKLPTLLLLVRWSALLTKFIKCCFLLDFFLLGENNTLKLNFVKKVQHSIHLLDNTLVRTASFVGRNEGKWVISDSGSLLMISTRDLEVATDELTDSIWITSVFLLQIFCIFKHYQASKQYNHA
jgi:hypothetical protein